MERQKKGGKMGRQGTPTTQIWSKVRMRQGEREGGRGQESEVEWGKYCGDEVGRRTLWGM